jgi:phage gp29-like protein
MLQVNKNYGIVGVAFTPDFYKRAFLQWQLGIYRDVYALIDRAECDGFIAGCLTARHSGYKRKYQISAVSDDATDQKTAQFVNDTFENLNMRVLFENIIEAKLKKYSVIALNWETVDNQQVVTSFKFYDQKYFRIDPKDEILKIDMGSNLIPIEPDSALIIEYHKKMIMLTILKAFIRKEFGEESWSSFLEIFGEPFIWGEYPPGLGDKERENLEQGIQQLGASARAVVPQGSKVNITEATRSTADHKDYKEDVKTEISLALLGHEKAAGTQQKGLQVGGNNDAFRVTQHIAIDDMDFIESAIQPLIRMLVNRNFPNIRKYPKLVFDKSDAADPKDKLAAAQLAFNAGAEIDASFFDDFGVPILNREQPLKVTPLFPGDQVL